MTFRNVVRRRRLVAFVLPLGRLCVALALTMGVACTTRTPPQKEELIRRGDELVAQKQFTQAAEALELAVKADPRDGELRMKLADAYSRAGDFGRASIEWVRAADLLPTDADAQILAATGMLSQGRFIDAADRASAVLREHPENVGALLAWANATAHLFNSTAAIYSLTDTIQDRAKYDAARGQLRSRVSASDDDAAEAAFRKVLELSPTMSEGQIAFANFLWAVGRPDESESMLRAVADRMPAHALVNRALGSYYLSRGREVEGERYLRNAAALGQFGRGAGLALADYYIRSNQPADAEPILQTLSAANDADGEVTIRLATVMFRLQRPGEAVRRLDGLLAREPNDARALLLRAQVLQTMGNPDPRFARAAVAADLSSSEAKTVLGQVLSAAGDVDTALEQYAEAFRMNPGATRAWIELVRLTLALGRDDEAGQLAREAVGRLSDDREARVLLVRALIRAQDYAAAERELQSLQSRYEGSPDVLTEVGALRAARGDAAAARAAFARALEGDRESFEALSGIVSLDLKARNLAGARALVDPAVAAHPRSPNYLWLAAQVYEAGNDAPRRESVLRQVLDIDRTNVQASMSLADLLMHQRRRDEASRLLDQLIQQRPRLVEAQMAAASLAEEMGRVDEARTRYEKIVSDNPATSTAAYRLARLYADQQVKLDVALTLAVAAAQKLPDDPGASDALGWVYTRKDLPELALPRLQTAVRVVPDNAVYRYHLGSAYLKSGDLKNARDQFTRALQLDEHLPAADEVRRALAGILQ